MKKLLILIPEKLKHGQPSFQRINSFAEFYKRQGVNVYVYPISDNIIGNIRLIFFLYKNSIRNVFISMPPFRRWFLFCLPYINIILDIRDGWSIAMRSGYGGTVKPHIIKSIIAGIIEKAAICRSALTITCTPGLQSYLQDKSKKQIAFISNGVNQEDVRIVGEIIRSKGDASFETAVCAGQFSECGKEKIKMILQKIAKRNIKTIIKLIGCDSNKNQWIDGWISENGINNIKINILPWMNRLEMYHEIVDSDYGIFVVRDPNYEFGTKIFDYILCRIPIFNYFDKENEFTAFFKDYLLTSISGKTNEIFIREKILDINKNVLINELVPKLG